MCQRNMQFKDLKFFDEIRVKNRESGARLNMKVLLKGAREMYAGTVGGDFGVFSTFYMESERFDGAYEITKVRRASAGGGYETVYEKEGRRQE